MLCSQPTGLYVADKISSFDRENVDCDASCGSAVRNAFRPVLVTDDVFIDGERPPSTGIYCVRNSASVTRCNTATSELVRGLNGRWSCLPLWPAIFGGADGSDILVCGGKLADGRRTYEYRLPPAASLRPIHNPYTEVGRFNCAPGQYIDGPRDHMNNEYLPLETNRFQRIRNNCAKYVANAIDIVKPMKGRSDYCNCLLTHGSLRRHGGDRTKVLSASGSGGGTAAGAKVNDDHVATVPLDENTVATVFQVAHPCSPCTASGHLVATDGIFNHPVRCTKFNQSHFEGIDHKDRLPCGVEKFESASQPSCLNLWIYVGDNGMSAEVKKALKQLEY